jgi:hypothetical protein
MEDSTVRDGGGCLVVDVVGTVAVGGMEEILPLQRVLEVLHLSTWRHRSS